LRRGDAETSAPLLPYALAAHLKLLEEEAGSAPWMIAGVCIDVRPPIAEAVRALLRGRA